MVNNPPPLLTDLILIINLTIKRTIIIILLIGNLMARARVNSPSPLTYYMEQRYNHVPDFPNIHYQR